MSVKLSPVLNDQQFSDAGILLSGGKIETYLAGSSTPAATFTTSAGNVAQANPIILNTRGEVDNLIYLTAGVTYKFILKDSNNNVLRTYGNIQGVNDLVGTVDQWVDSGVSPTFVNTTQFTLSGDQINAFHVNRRVKLLTTAGTVYGYISASVFTTLTTVTVVLDSGVLDSGLSSVQLGLITPINTSVRIVTSMLADGALSADVAGRLKTADGYTTPAKLSTGGPTWDASGNASITGNFSAGIATATAKIHAYGVSSTGFAGNVKAQNNTTNTGYTGYEFQVDPTYTKQAIASVRQSLNGLGYMGFYVDSLDDAANWTVSDEKFRIEFTGQQKSVIVGGSTLLPVYDCRAWVNFNGTGTVAIRASGNVSSITDNGAGLYVVNLSTAMSDANFSAVGSVALSGGSNSQILRVDGRTTTSVTLTVVNISGASVDSDSVNLSIFR